MDQIVDPRVEKYENEGKSGGMSSCLLSREKV